MYSLLKNPTLLSHLGMKEITSSERVQPGVRWEGILSKFQFDRLLDLGRYYALPLSPVETGEKNHLLMFPTAPIVYRYIRNHLKSQWLKIIIYYYHCRLVGLSWAAPTWSPSCGDSLGLSFPGGSLDWLWRWVTPRAGVDFRSCLGVHWGLSTREPMHGLSRWLWFLGHGGWILRRNRYLWGGGGGCKSSYNRALEVMQCHFYGILLVTLGWGRIKGIGT